MGLKDAVYTINFKLFVIFNKVFNIFIKYNINRKSSSMHYFKDDRHFEDTLCKMQCLTASKTKLKLNCKLLITSDQNIQGQELS